MPKVYTENLAFTPSLLAEVIGELNGYLIK